LSKRGTTRERAQKVQGTGGQNVYRAGAERSHQLGFRAEAGATTTTSRKGTGWQRQKVLQRRDKTKLAVAVNKRVKKD